EVGFGQLRCGCAHLKSPFARPKKSGCQLDATTGSTVAKKFFFSSCARSYLAMNRMTATPIASSAVTTDRMVSSGLEGAASAGCNAVIAPVAAGIAPVTDGGIAMVNAGAAPDMPAALSLTVGLASPTGTVGAGRTVVS